MDKEKRLYQRLIVGHPARCALSESSDEYFPATLLDIGPDGVGFLHDDPLDRGAKVYFRVDIGNGGEVKFAAEVRWCRQARGMTRFQTGARICEIAREDLEKFVRFYCERLFPAQRAKKKILVVEDEAGMSKLLRLELTQNGYDVVCAHDGESGFAKYMAERPDLIVLDIMLPKMNGYEVCRRIRREQDDARTPIVMLTAKKGDADRIVGGVVGAQRYLTKPFDAEHLLGEIAELLAAPKAWGDGA